MTQQQGKTRKVFDGRYEILSIVGRGACSVVYHARHVAGGAGDVALKVLLNRKGERPNTDRLRKEALAMVSSRHRYVIRLDDFHSVGDLCYLSMEYAPESDLRKFIERSAGKLPVQQGERFLVQTAEALGFIHRAGIIHRDIKPENILVMNDNEIRLGDFGVAVLPGEESSLDELQKGVGTMDYMAPEVLEGIGYDQRADVYALGVTFYELLSGKHPFAGVPLMEQIDARKSDKLAHVSDLEPSISRKLGDVLMKAMSFERDQRYSGGRDLLQAILLARSKEGGETAPQRQVPARERARVGERRPLNKPRESIAASPAAARENPPREAPPREAPPREAPPAQPAAAAASPDETPRVAPPKPSAPARGNVAPMRPIPQRRERKPIEPAAPEREREPDMPPPIDALPPSPPAPPTSGPPPVEPEPVDLPGPSGEPASLLRNRRARVREGSERRTEMSIPPITDGPGRRAAAKSAKAAPDAPAGPVKRLNLPVKPVAMIAAVAALVYMALSMLAPVSEDEVTVAGSSGYTASGGELSGEAPRIGSDVTFPLLPAGIYSGSIEGLAPGGSAPLTIVSMRDRAALAVAIGMEGWVPRVISLERHASVPEGAQMPALRVASNGFVLDLTGQSLDGELLGYFRNIVTGEQGRWRLSPLRQ